MDHQIKISVIIPVYNNQSELSNTFDSLRRQTFPKEKFEIIISDDGSQTDMHGFVLKNAPKGIETRYFFQEDKGFRPGEARNMGIRNALGEICLFIDCGIILSKECLQRHYEAHQKGCNYVVLGYVYGINKNPDLALLSKIINENSIESAIRILEDRGGDMIDGREPLYQEHGDDLTHWPAPWVVLWSLHFSVSTAFMINNNIFFDSFFNTWGCEDNDFGIALQNHGGKFTLCRMASSIHYPPKIASYQRIQTDEKFHSNFMCNKRYLFEKYKDNESVRIWYEKGMFDVNRIMLALYE